jgi:hypothetical protein
MAKAKTEETTELAVLPPLVIAPERPTPVTGNFEELEKAFSIWEKQMDKLKLTDDNMELVLLVKSTAVQRRTLLTKAKTDNNRIYFNQPKDLFSKKMDNLIAYVTRIEAKADKILDKREEERCSDITAVLDIYREQFQKQYRLIGKFLARVDYRKNYYNKGADEKERKDDLEQQFKDAKKDQDAYEAGVRLVTGLCTDPRLNRVRYIRMLDTESAAVVSEEILDEIKRLKQVDADAALDTGAGPGSPDGDATEDEAEPEAADAPYTEAEEVSDAESIVLGITGGIDFSTDFPGREKKTTVEIIYPCDMGPALTELFKQLWRHGIKTRTVKEPTLNQDSAEQRAS